MDKQGTNREATKATKNILRFCRFLRFWLFNVLMTILIILLLSLSDFIRCHFTTVATPAHHVVITLDKKHTQTQKA